MAHHRAGRVSDAQELYRQVLSVDPGNADVHSLLGGIAYQQKRYAEAIESISHAIAGWEQSAPPRPPNPVAYNNLGEAYRAAGRSADAKACYLKALAIRPAYAEPHYHLGLVLQDEDRYEEAIAHYRQAIALKPDLVFAQYNLGVALKHQGNVGEAIACFQQVLRLDPDNGMAKFGLSSLIGLNPDRPPEQYVANLFDNHAERFDKHLVEELRYRVPEQLVPFVLGNARNQQRNWDLLDLGCGTGLAGVAFASFARQLVGVDLSSKMLEKARARALYQRLEQQDLLAMMTGERAASYDAIIATDVFIYVGNLAAIVQEARRLLRPDGFLAFSVEASEDAPGNGDASGGTDFRLQASGRYSHSSSYLRRLATSAGFGTVEISPIDTRLEGGSPVRGFLIFMAM